MGIFLKSLYAESSFSTYIITKPLSPKYISHFTIRMLKRVSQFTNKATLVYDFAFKNWHNCIRLLLASWLATVVFYTPSACFSSVNLIVVFVCLQ